MKASELNWSDEINPNLAPHEWPGDVLDYMDARIIRVMSDIRSMAGVPMFPSPLQGAHVRHRARRPGNGDRHATDNGKRLADGTDFFVRWEDAPAVVEAIRQHRGIQCFGLYNRMSFKGTPGDFCMIHVDLRDQPISWVGNGRSPIEYVYDVVEPDRFKRLMSEALDRVAA